MPESDGTMTPDTLAALSAAAGLTLSAERRRELLPHAQAILDGVRRLRQVDVSAVEPPGAFLPRRARGRPSR